MSTCTDLFIGKPAPSFEGKAYFQGKFVDLKLEDYAGKYVVLFFYPLDFTFVCPTELLSFDDHNDELAANKTVLIGCSVDSQFSHMRWCQTPLEKGGLRELKYPLLSDLSKEIGKKYNSLITCGPNNGVTLRSTFIIDGKGVLRHMSYNDLPVGRNVNEIVRLVQAFQYVDENGEVCPSKWTKKGDPTMKGSHEAKETEEYWKNQHGK